MQNLIPQHGNKNNSINIILYNKHERYIRSFEMNIVYLKKRVQCSTTINTSSSDFYRYNDTE